MLCRNCKSGDRCPSVQQPVEVDCPRCEGQGCEECADVGHFELTSCARKQLPPDIPELLMYCDFMQKGLAPVRGAVLDQDRQFLDAYTFVAAERIRLQAEAMRH